jgi:ElaA protein
MYSDQVNSKSFNELTKAELYAILALRIEVFCVEQNCPYQDADGQDQEAQHVFIKSEKSIMAYARILKDKDNPNKQHIGRVVVNPNYRRKGLAKHIMQACIDEIESHTTVIEISAQSYLSHFYQGLGFKNTGKYYLEDDIPHEQMHYMTKMTD